MSGQTNVLAELLAAGANPYARCSSGETPLDLAGRNGHNDALSCLICHSPPMATPPAAGVIEAAHTANDTSTPPSQEPVVTLAPTPKPPGKGGISLFRRKSPKGADGTAAKKTKKGRGKRPGVTGRGDGKDGGTPRSVAGTSDGGIDVGGGWIMYTDAEGFQYCWNETLQESRWVDETANLRAAPGPSPTASGIAPERLWGGFGTAEINHNNFAASAVHSPGWPSPRAAGDGFMQLPLPGEPTNYHGTPSAAAPGIAMPPTPPEMPSRSAGRGGSGGGWQTQAHDSGEAVGVAWLGMAEPTAASTNQAGGGAAATTATGGAAAAVANAAFYGQEQPPSPATKGKLWAERVKAAGENTSKAGEQDATPVAAKRRAWMKNFRHNRDTKGKARSRRGKHKGEATGSSSGSQSGNDADDISALTEEVGEGADKSSNGSSGSSTSSSSSSSSSSSTTSSGSGSDSSSSTEGDSSDTSDTDSSDSSDSTRSTSESVTGGRMPSPPTPPTIAPEQIGGLTPPQPVGASLPVAVAAPPDQAWSGQHPTVAGVPAVGVPVGYAPPPDVAFSGGHPTGYGRVDNGAGYGGWADLEPQLQAHPPNAPTALWRQERPPAGYGAVAQQGSDGTYGVGFDQQEGQPEAAEADHLITLSSSPPNDR
eukprot:g3038.t1